ncbi:hypothetical protein H2198_007460 [Neophaeococcomyces mojaviensis]|uniref:Uncharacterized protein n=1 Tax=Neophaeococcomyces mojaviensis TaxID=3383035 RepID=A0ACC3A001_9EURO|nr:hypothetical protein H2198_007460 [Knufia sp. JES_112]
MSFSDPRGDLPLPQVHFALQQLSQHRRSFRKLSREKTARRVPCYDWIFSSATNIHIAVDKSTFKTFAAFDSYVLTVAGQRPIPARGIGSVDLRIRCKPNSRDGRVITLDNVLYVPSWACNIFSDCYFDPPQEFEHNWTENGVCFTRKTSGKIKAWGYTETFCGLDRLVLSRKPRGRSPMLEDKDREVWSVNLNWPQSQRDKWEVFYNKELQRLAKEHEAEIMAQQQTAKKKMFTESTELLLPKNRAPNANLKTGSPASVAKLSVKSKSENNLARVMARQVSAASLDLKHTGARMSLNEISKNLAIKTEPETRVSSLKASFNAANRGLLKDFLAAQSKESKAA